MSSSEAQGSEQGTWLPNAVEPVLDTRPTAAPSNYEMRVGPGWTLNDGTFTHIPQTRRYKRDVPRPSFVHHAHEAMYALTSLQVAHNAPITLCAMDIAVEHVWRCLPREVKKLIKIIPPNGPELWSENEQAVQDMYQKMSENPNTLLQDTKKNPWVVWPIYLEDEFGHDWLVILWYAEESQPNSGVYDRIRTCEIFDARRDNDNPRDFDGERRCTVPGSRKERVGQRFTDFVKQGGYNVDEMNSSHAMMAPMEYDEHTSGERCFAAVKDILDLILSMHIDGRTYNPANNWFPSLSRWVNPYQFRIEMTGINAWWLMGSFDYNARIVVECMEPGLRRDIVVAGEHRLIEAKGLAGRPWQPPIATVDYTTEPYV
ncbi:hypothetical protein F5Y02DRAFT_343565 [Annulohypoxylon stygium]|nr:hypothetical protein F5Y02DRAFT_343565 [Annulohypoxylon stygium]